LAFSIGTSGPVTWAEMLKPIPLVTSSTKPPNFPFLKISTRRRAASYEGLNSSLAQSAGKLWSCKVERK